MSARESPAEPRKDLLSAFLQLSALSGFALAQPVLDTLKRDAAFFVARRSEAADILLFAFGIALAPPLLLFAVELLAGAVHRRARVALHFVFVAMLSSAIVLPPLKRAVELGPELMLGLGGALGLLIALACTRLATVKAFLSILSPVPLVAVALFLLHTPIAKLLRADDGSEVALAQIDSDTNVVFMIFDELPVTSLMNSNEEISEKLFPNFARLAANSTWFRNNTACHVQTMWAVPGLMTGMRPSETDLLPIASDHPRSIFTLLARSHRIRAIETSTQVCPEHLLDNAPEAGATLGERLASLQSDFSIFYAHMVLPRQMTWRLPSVTETWGNWGVRAAERGRGSTAKPWRRRGEPLDFLDEFIELIDESDDPTLYVVHVNVPHSPWTYTENGLSHIAPENKKLPFPGQSDGVWLDDEWPTNLALQHHLLQLGNLDRYLGRILDRLEETGIYEESVIVLTADHGVSFRPGHHRRRASEENLVDLMQVPLLVKLPLQSEGRIDDTNVESIDVLSTIADALGCELPWEVDGSSALDPSGDRRETKSFFNVGNEMFTVDGERPDMGDVLRRKEALFGADPSWDDVYAMGDSTGLVGRPIDDFEVTPSVVVRGVIDDQFRFEHVDPESGFVPGTVEGHIVAKRSQLVPRRLAIVINGTIRAVMRTFEKNSSAARFAVTVPAHSFIPGANSCVVYSIGKDGALKQIPTATFKLLHRQGQERIVSADGRQLAIRAGVVDGVVNSVMNRRGETKLVGWAGDIQRDLAAEGILFIHEGTGISHHGPTGIVRLDLRRRHRGKKHLQRGGFNLVLPDDAFEASLDGSLRAFGIIGNVASELRFGAHARWAWARQPDSTE